MKYIPILFSTAMVQAILEGRKTQTRRVIKGIALDWLNDFTPEFVADPENSLCPYGQPGDVLWVRETFAPPLPSQRDDHFMYAADFLKKVKGIWKPSIFMPKKACRIWLEVVNVRAERLHDITEEDAIAEGIQAFTKDNKLYKYGLDGWEWSLMPKTAREAFFMLWAIVNGQESFEANPWVWVVEFKQIEKPENF